MNLTLTLVGQSITFIVFVWFTMKFVWPPIMAALEARRKTIADGLAAAERGKRELELADQRKDELVREAKKQAQEIMSQAEKRAAEIVDESKGNAKLEADRILAAAKTDIAQEINRAKEQLRASVAQLAVAGASKIIDKEIDAKTHAKLIEGVVNQL